MRLISFLLLFSSLCVGATTIQIKDFICGCEYCDTVNTGEPLDIGRHMIMCHSWREATLKTIRIMNETKKPKLKNKDSAGTKQKQKTEIANKKNPNKHHHRWSQDNTGTWTYSDENYLLNNDGWMYREDLGWLWSFNKKTFLYSEHYGWLYNYSANNRRIYYWYDRRGWYRPSKIPQYK